MLRACQFAKPIFLKAALNSNPLSLVQIQVSDVFCKEGELKGAPAWKYVKSNKQQMTGEHIFGNQDTKRLEQKDGPLTDENHR